MASPIANAAANRIANLQGIKGSSGPKPFKEPSRNRQFGPRVTAGNRVQNLGGSAYPVKS